ncbi:hypothetical protein FBR05_05480 [Deltaproteobacteria bacterium PRO3]|nr:hypothetical protein [Deltaproteobacteria bacterium PRO3]
MKRKVENGKILGVEKNRICQALIALTAVAAVGVFSGCGGKGAGNPGNGAGSGGSSPVGGAVEPMEILSQGRNATEYVLSKSLHPQGVGLVLRAFLPDGSSLFEGGAAFPLAFGYHGSGGLNREAEQAGQECTQELETAYREMTEFLNAQGVAVVWIDSFYSRDPRFCEDNDADFQQFAPPAMDNNLQQVVSRLYDAAFAEQALCSLTRFDCSKYIRIGTSEGGTAAILPSHRFVDRTLVQLFDPKDPDNELEKLTDIAFANLPANRPQPKFVLAISPGCGFYGAIPFSIDGETEDLFYPSQDLFLEIGGSDDIPEECAVAIGDGRRQLQAEEIQNREGISEEDFRYHLTIYPGAGHALWEARQEEIKAKLIPLIQQRLK